MALRDDLQKHLIIAPFTAAAGAVGFEVFALPLLPHWGWSLLTMLCAVIGKEVVWDGWLKRGTRAWDDLIAGLVSGSVVVIAIALN